MLELLESHNITAVLDFIGLRAGIILVVWLFAVIACLFDFWSGINTAKAIGEPLKSHGFRRAVTKIGDYARILMFILMFDFIGFLFTFYKLPFATILCGIAILLIEGKSMIENSRRKRAHAGDIPEVVKDIIKAATSAQGKGVLNKIEKYILDNAKKEGKDEGK